MQRLSRLLLVPATALLLVTALRAAPPPQAESERFTLHDLGHGAWAAIARPGSGAGANAGFLLTDDGVAVVDTFQSPAAAQELVAAIRRRTDRPIRFVVDTHYHLDHVAGNGVLRAAGATLLAQRNVRAWERTENLKWWGAEVPAQARALVESLVLPEVVYDEGVDLYLGDRKLEVRSLPGHTGSDSIVVVPDAGVVFTGDLFWNRTLPNTTDADTAAWLETDERLVLEHPSATFVPGHGEVGAGDDVRAFRGYLEELRATIAKARADGASDAELVDRIEPGLRRRYGDWAFYDHFVRDDITQTAAELAGTKRLPGVRATRPEE